MITKVSTCAKSPLGKLLALAAITALLLYIGLYLATDGGINLKLLASLKSISTPAMQQSQRDLLQALSDRFKKYDRVELLALYGVGIFAAFLAHGLLGTLIRSYRFNFLPARGLVERQSMWLCAPLWLAAWLVMAIGNFLLIGPSRTFTLWMPLWFWLTLATPALLLWATWAWFPEWLEGRLVRIPRLAIRVPLWSLLTLAVMLLVMFTSLLFGATQKIPLPVPTWLLSSLLIPPLLLLPAHLLRPTLTRRMFFIPGLKRRVPFSRIKRMEVQSHPDGGTSLTLTFHDEWSWTLHDAPPKRLLRLGTVLGRITGLKRHDLVTWG